MKCHRNFFTKRRKIPCVWKKHAYVATNVASTNTWQDNPPSPFCRRGDLIVFCWSMNQEQLCWRRPRTIYWTKLTKTWWDCRRSNAVCVRTHLLCLRFSIKQISDKRTYIILLHFAASGLQKKFYEIRVWRYESCLDAYTITFFEFNYYFYA
jgi:hypothetical protein